MRDLLTGTLGKQTVYHAIQDPQNSVSEEELGAMEMEVQKLQDLIKTAKANEVILKANFIKINAELSTQDLHANITALEVDRKDVLSRLEKLRSGTMKPISLAEKETVDKSWAEWKRKAASRKRIFMDMWAVVLDGLPEGRSKEELWVL